METALIKCPNCGANATNHTNCEYCGSLLVRFAAAGVDLSKTTYTNDSATFPRFADELRKNLQLQEGNFEIVATDLYSVDSGNKSAYVSSIYRTGHANWQDHTPISLSDSLEGLTLSFSFAESDPDYKRFKMLSSYQLFTQHISIIKKRKRYEYAIDFGKDADGAARLLSEIYEKVFRISHMQISYHTNLGKSDIYTDRSNMGIIPRPTSKESDNDSNNDSDDWTDYMWWIIGGLAVGILCAMF